MKETVIPIVTSAFGIGTEGLGNKSISGDHSNYCIALISENTN